MEPYRKMYYRLFNRISDIIQELETIQTEAEEFFLAQEKTDFAAFPSPKNENWD